MLLYFSPSLYSETPWKSSLYTLCPILLLPFSLTPAPSKLLLWSLPKVLLPGPQWPTHPESPSYFRPADRPSSLKHFLHVTQGHAPSDYFSTLVTFYWSSLLVPLKPQSTAWSKDLSPALPQNALARAGLFPMLTVSLDYLNKVASLSGFQTQAVPTNSLLLDRFVFLWFSANLDCWGSRMLRGSFALCMTRGGMK